MDLDVRAQADEEVSVRKQATIIARESRRAEVLAQLRIEEERLLQVAKDFREQLRIVDVERREVQRAIGALDRDTKSAKRSGLSSEEVTNAVKSLLEHGPLEGSAIKERVYELARKRGKSRKGLHLAISRALKNRDIAQDGLKYRIER